MKLLRLFLTALLPTIYPPSCPSAIFPDIECWREKKAIANQVRETKTIINNTIDCGAEMQIQLGAALYQSFIIIHQVLLARGGFSGAQLDLSKEALANFFQNGPSSFGKLTEANLLELESIYFGQLTDKVEMQDYITGKRFRDLFDSWVIKRCCSRSLLT